MIVKTDCETDGSSAALLISPLCCRHGDLFWRGRELPGQQQARRHQQRGDAQLGVAGQLHHDHLQEVTEHTTRVNVSVGKTFVDNLAVTWLIVPH